MTQLIFCGNYYWYYFFNWTGPPPAGCLVFKGRGWSKHHGLFYCRSAVIPAVSLVILATYKLKRMKALTTPGEAQQHLVMPVKTGIQEGMDPSSLDPGLRQDDQDKRL